MKLNEQQLLAKQERERFKQKKQEVEELKVKAEYWEYQWKIRHFTLECEKLREPYNQYLEEQVKLQQEELEKFKQEMERLAKETKEKEEENALSEQ